MAKLNANIDLNAWFQDAQDQFKGLNPNEPGQWPVLPKAAAFIAAAALVVLLGWVALLSGQQEELQSERNREPQLKADFQNKVTQAVNLELLRKQRIQVEEYVKQMEKQLPGKADMDALLSDINQAGLGRGLEFELFRPGQVVVKDYYAELPIAIRVTGRYHDIGAFTADVANLSRIVTLHELVIGNVASKDASGNLYMEATARTYRYLDPAEVQANKDAKTKAGTRK
jgi:type IV pilus assembly protein PilO